MRGDREAGFQPLKNNKGRASTTGIILQIQVFFCKRSAFILLLPEVY